MKRWKKYTGILLAVVFCLSLTACGEDDDGGNNLLPNESKAVPVLMSDALPFTNMETLQSENHEDGTYYYSDITEDGQIIVVNTVLPRNFADDGQTFEDYLTDCALNLGKTDTCHLQTVEKNDALTVKMSYPVYIVIYTAGENEDAREWTVFAMDTDLYTYLYGFCATPDAADDVKSVYQDIFAGLYMSDGKNEYTGAWEPPEELARELTELTGLDFFITASKADDGWIIDWAADSTVVAGLDDREQTEFIYFNQDSVRWFMMDSLWRNLTEKLDTENIYYTMDGGRELAFEKLYPVNIFPSDIPYMGSGFYYAHADVRGDEETPYARTRGLWRLDGMTDTASIEMDGFGGFTMYYASGSVEAEGYLECTDEYENGDFRYDCYTVEGELIVSFYFDSDTQLHIGNEEGTIYLLDTQ